MTEGKLQLSFKDYDREIGSVGFRGATLTVGNFATQETLMDTLAAAVEAVTIGAKEVETRVVIRTDLNALPPSDAFAQRETKWLVRSRDTGGNSVVHELPTADLDLLVANTNQMDISGGLGAALVTSIEAFALSKAGLAIEVDEIIHVGRNI